CQHYYSTPLTL
nr:immunoglobulin light chain junction region [Macaca mulatta]